MSISTLEHPDNSKNQTGTEKITSSLVIGHIKDRIALIMNTSDDSIKTLIYESIENEIYKTKKMLYVSQPGQKHIKDIYLLSEIRILLNNERTKINDNSRQSQYKKNWISLILQCISIEKLDNFINRKAFKFSKPEDEKWILDLINIAQTRVRQMDMSPCNQPISNSH